jgi:hypothetical protein
MFRPLACFACFYLLATPEFGAAQQNPSAQAKALEALQLYGTALQHVAQGEYDEAADAAGKSKTLRPGWGPPAQLLTLLEPAAQRGKLRTYARAAGKDDESSVAQLAQYLKKGAEDEESRAWLLYCWLTDRIAYDVPAFLSGEYRTKDSSPATVLRERQAVCEGYSKLFTAVGKAMGLEVVSIPGYAKGFNYSADVDYDKISHAWNAVRIDGKWRLVDSTWGAGAVKDGQFEKRFDAFFFGPSSQALILSHYPRKQADQFLDSPLPLDQFKSWRKVEVRALVRCGFDPSDIQDKLAHGIDPVEAYSIACPFKAQVPLERDLDSQKSYSLKVEGVAVQGVAIIHAGKWLYAARRGSTFSGHFRGLEGDFTVVLQPFGQEKWSTIFKYRGLKRP